MPREVLVDAFVSVNAVDLSDHAASVTVTTSEDLQEATVMGDTGKRRLSSKIRDAQIEIEFRQDYDAAKVDATLAPLLGVETAVAVRKSKADGVSATNPETRINGIMAEYQPAGGAVGEVHNLSVTFQNSDGLAPVRAVA